MNNRKLISEFYDPNLVKPGDFFTDFGLARVSLTPTSLCPNNLYDIMSKNEFILEIVS